MDQEFSDLQPHERQLTAQWKDGRSGMGADEIDERIFWLVTKRLLPRGRSDDGWSALFEDPRDGRLWELTFPSGSLFGGGPRQLTLLSPQVAADKYGGRIAE